MPVVMGTVLKGKFVPDDTGVFRRVFFPLEGKRVTVKVERLKRLTSNSQRRYYFCKDFMGTMCEVTGYTKDEMHEALMWHYHRIVREGFPPTRRHLSDLSTVEFEEYTKRIREDASAGTLFGKSVWLPEPNEANIDERFL